MNFVSFISINGPIWAVPTFVVFFSTRKANFYRSTSPLKLFQKTSTPISCQRSHHLKHSKCFKWLLGLSRGKTLPFCHGKLQKKMIKFILISNGVLCKVFQGSFLGDFGNPGRFWSHGIFKVLTSYHPPNKKILESIGLSLGWVVVVWNVILDGEDALLRICFNWVVEPLPGMTSNFNLLML